MGVLMYGPSASEIDIDDRLLAHLKVVMLSKLRRSESFTISWDIDPDQGSGRETIWIHPAIPLRFRFSGSRPPQLNRAWLDQLARAANRGDLRLSTEPPSGEQVPHPLTDFS
ncbi:DUF7882 family protein [Herbiconiux daphne]|nr:hypothetical protein [Herbiconiux daphne]